MFFFCEVYYLVVCIAEGTEDTEDAENAFVSRTFAFARDGSVTKHLLIPRPPRSLR